MAPILIEIFIYVGTMMGALASYLAHKRGKNPYFWFVMGFLMGLTGIFFLFLASRKKVSAEKAVAPSLPPDRMLFKFWYYLDSNNSQLGPVSSLFLHSLWKEGKVEDETYVWNEDLKDWVRFKEIISIFPKETDRALQKSSAL